jgi:hypothetical protein
VGAAATAASPSRLETPERAGRRRLGAVFALDSAPWSRDATAGAARSAPIVE